MPYSQLVKFFFLKENKLYFVLSEPRSPTENAVGQSATFSNFEYRLETFVDETTRTLVQFEIAKETLQGIYFLVAEYYEFLTGFRIVIHVCVM